MYKRWQEAVEARVKACAKCNEAFGAGREVLAVLGMDASGLYVRGDLCAKCEKKKRMIDDVLCVWRRKTAEKKQREVSGDEGLLELLEAKMGEEGEEARRMAFTLALYLERKKVLVRRKEMGEGDLAVDYFEVVGSGELLPVKKVDVLSVSASAVLADLRKWLA